MCDDSSRSKILVVEDEVLVSFMIVDFVEESGWKAVGPAHSVNSALKKVEVEKFCAAVLDINLGGEKVYPVARAIQAKGIPYIFMTGYGKDGIDPEFSNVRVLEKPIRYEVLKEALSSKLASSECSKTA